jgi:hypothetical protein
MDLSDTFLKVDGPLERRGGEGLSVLASPPVAWARQIEHGYGGGHGQTVLVRKIRLDVWIPWVVGMDRSGPKYTTRFPPNATHKMCCNMPYLVAIDTIATKLLRGPSDAKARVALGYCNVVHQVVAKVLLLQRNATLQLGFFTTLVLVAKCTIATHLGCCQRCNCNVSVSLQIIVLLRTEFGCYRLNLLYYQESNLVAICSIVWCHEIG